jgi:hypothetical protein
MTRRPAITGCGYRTSRQCVLCASRRLRGARASWVGRGLRHLFVTARNQRSRPSFCAWITRITGIIPAANRDQSEGVVGRRGHRSECQDGVVLVGDELGDCAAGRNQQLGDCLGGDVPNSQPDHLGWRSVNEGEIVEVGVLSRPARARAGRRYSQSSRSVALSRPKAVAWVLSGKISARR